jgi:hypothetical protein
MTKSLIKVVCSSLPCAVAFLFLSLSAYGQFNSTIEGNVTDASGSPVPNCKITLKDIDTGVEHKTTTNSAGDYVFPTLPPGHYTVTAVATGFQTFVQENLTLLASSMLKVPAKLTVGNVATTVNVTAEPPPVQTDEAKITTVVTQLELNDLPLADRNILNVVALTPGVTGTGMMGGNSQGVMVANQFPAISANGTPNSSNEFYIDGTSVNDSPSSGDARVVVNPDAISEVVVSANEFAAEYGRGSGVVVQMVTKSGTDQFHGSLFELLQNSALNARNEFQNTANSATGHVIPPSRLNEFGGSFGGPIWKDHTFFYASWDQTISSVASPSIQQVEAPQFVSFMETNYPSNLSTQLLKSYPPSVGPLSNFQTVAQVMKSQLGTTCSGVGPAGLPCNLPMLASGVHDFSAPNNGYQGTIRLDQYFTNDRFYGNYIPEKQTTDVDNVRPNWNFAVPVPTFYAAVNWTHTFSASLINETSLGGTHNAASSQCKLCNIPQININGIPQFGYNWAPLHFAQGDIHWRDVMSLVEGKHTIKAGAEIFFNQDFAPFTSYGSRPTYGFNNIFQFVQDTPQSETGPYEYNPVTGGIANQDRYWEDWYYAGFLQDDWKIKPNLTISVGLRGEYAGNPYERYGNRSDLFLGSGDNFVQEIANSYVAIHKYAYNSGIGRIAPRIGFAWQPRGHPNLSIRGGWGIFVDRGGNTIWSDTASSNPPLVASLNLQITSPTGPYPTFGLCALSVPPFNCDVPALPLGLNPRGGPLGPPVSVGGPDLGMKLAYAENRFFGIQRAFGPKFVIEADYTGSHGVDLYAKRNLNTYVGDQLANGGKFVGINPFFSAINYADNSNYSEYNGLTLSARKSYGNGIVLNTAFTYSHTIDLISQAPGVNKSETNSTVINAWYLGNQKATSTQDIPFQFTFDFVYNVPTPRNWGSFARGVLGGWQASGVGTFASGTPFTVYNGSANWSSQAIFYDVPNAPIVALPYDGYSRSQWLTGIFPASDFPSPCPAGTGPAGCGVVGNLGRNTFRGPGFSEVDAGFAKTNRIPWFVSEGAELQFRAELINAFNRVNLTNVSSNLTSGTFGRATGVREARTPQFSIRIHF